MKSSRSGGFEQADNAQVAVDQASFFIVACSLSNHPNDKAEAEPTLGALSPALGTPAAAALDNGFWSEQNRTALEERQIEPYIATGREPHHQSWQERFAAEPEPPAEDASPQIKMAYKLRTEIGQAIYRLRKCTVEPVIGIIKAVLGFRQFSLRGLDPTDREWCLVCLAFNLKRLHTLPGPNCCRRPAKRVSNHAAMLRNTANRRNWEWQNSAQHALLTAKTPCRPPFPWQ